MALGLVGSCVCDVAHREETIETFERWEGRLGGRRKGWNALKSKSMPFASSRSVVVVVVVVVAGRGARAGTVAVVWNAAKNFGTTGGRRKRGNATTRCSHLSCRLVALRPSFWFAGAVHCLFFLFERFFQEVASPRCTSNLQRSPRDVQLELDRARATRRERPCRRSGVPLEKQ